MKYLTRFCLTLLILAGMNSQTCRAELSEAQVESAYILNFIKFAEWPADSVKSGSTITLCAMGNDELLETLTTLNGAKVGTYKLQIVSYNENTGVLSSCHVLYIDQREQRRFIPILKLLAGRPVLTISNIPNFAERGGNIGLIYRENKVQFEINLASTRIAGLRLSSQMLNLAANIFGK